MNDKEMHFIAGIIIYIIFTFIVNKPFAVVVLIAAIKEAYDAVSGKGHLELADFAATCLGGLVVAGLR